MRNLHPGVGSPACGNPIMPLRATACNGQTGGLAGRLRASGRGTRAIRKRLSGPHAPARLSPCRLFRDEKNAPDFRYNLRKHAGPPQHAAAIDGFINFCNHSPDFIKGDNPNYVQNKCGLSLGKGSLSKPSLLPRHLYGSTAGRVACKAVSDADVSRLHG